MSCATGVGSAEPRHCEINWPTWPPPHGPRRRLQSDLQEGFFNRISSRDAAERRGALLARTTGVSRTIGDAALDGVAQFDGEFTGLKVFGPDWFSVF